MNRGAYHPRRNKKGELIRKDGTPDGRDRQHKYRTVPYYVRLTPGTFAYLESLLDVPTNRQSGSAVHGCANRADIIEAAFEIFDRVDALARELDVRDTDLLVSAMIEAVRSHKGSAISRATLTVQTPIAALPAPRDTNT